MFDTLLIANRGEIAVRIAKTAKRMGVRTVAVYSEADRDALHVRSADQAVLIGPPDPRRSYLDGDRIILAAREAGAAAIHPGYGFLSENADFAERCAAAGLIFVGPPAEAIRAMGSKARAKALMEKAGVPVVPGYHGEMQDAQFLKRKAYEVGYPVLIKAVSGGGGKGMRRVDKAIDFEDALASARREAMAAFGDERVLVERFVNRPRHIEIQVFADGAGRAVSLFERDCSLQRRHQKIIEEAPAPGMTEAVRAAMGAAATRAAEAVGYRGAGTVEFIAEGEGALSVDGFFFMEMNTRLQVEHPVTECVTGYDLVEWQLRVAAGEVLPAGEPRPPRGHAVEARLYAEDPDNGFLPSAGDILALEFPAGVRVDAGVEAGDTVSPYYDPMIAKIIVHGPDRDGAWAALRAALDGTVALGPQTNLAFLRALAQHPEVLAGTHDTGLVDRDLAELTGGQVSAQAVADAAAALLAQQGLAGATEAPTEGVWQNPWGARDGFRLTGDATTDVSLTADGAQTLATLTPEAGGIGVEVGGVRGVAERARFVRADGDMFVLEGGRAQRLCLVDELGRSVEEPAQARAVAPMYGRIVTLFVSVGDRVEAGDRLYAIEAMKMEHTVKAGGAGVVTAIHAGAGEQVAEGAQVVSVGDSDAEAIGGRAALGDDDGLGNDPDADSLAGPAGGAGTPDGRGAGDDAVKGELGGNGPGGGEVGADTLGVRATGDDPREDALSGEGPSGGDVDAHTLGGSGGGSGTRGVWVADDEARKRAVGGDGGETS